MLILYLSYKEETRLIRTGHLTVSSYIKASRLCRCRKQSVIITISDNGKAGEHPCFEKAPRVGLEPTTLRLTAECSTIELSRIIPRFRFPSALPVLPAAFRPSSVPSKLHILFPNVPQFHEPLHASAPPFRFASALP